MRFLTVKTIFLLAISSLKRVGDLQALSVAPSCLEFAPGMVRAFLYPRPGYVPKVTSVIPQPVILQAFCPPPFWDAEQEKLNCVCPVQALKIFSLVSRGGKRPRLSMLHGSLRERDAASNDTLGTPLCSHALTYMCNPSEGIPADVTSGDDIATRKYKSTCGEDSGSFKVK